MVAAELLYLVVALLLGFALGVLALLLFRRKPVAREPPLARAPPPPPRASAPPPEAWSDDDDDAVEFALVDDEPPARAAPRAPPRAPPAPQSPPPARPAPYRPPPPGRPIAPEMDDPVGTVPTEWARRHVGPLEPGRVKGICSGCGTPISISTRRPLRVACPVCGRTRLLS